MQRRMSTSMRARITRLPRSHGALLGCVVVLLIAAGSAVEAAGYEVTPGEPNLVRFESKAPLESFDGRTRQVRGTLFLNPQSLSDSVEMTIEVDLKSLDTGIPLRNQHMQRNHLETERFPKAVFQARRLLQPNAPALTPGAKVTLQVEGDFSLHGVTRRIQVPVEVVPQSEAEGGGLRILAHFEVLLSDYQIARPQFLALKLDERQRVTVELVARPRS
jgi:polyisoprenoid-binding protein YceI